MNCLCAQRENHAFAYGQDYGRYLALAPQRFGMLLPCPVDDQIPEDLVRPRGRGTDIGDLGGFRERYYIDEGTVGFDGNHLHGLCRFFAEVFWRPGDPADKEHSLAEAVQGNADAQKGNFGEGSSGPMVTTSLLSVAGATEGLLRNT